MKEELFDITLDNLSGAMMLTIEPKENLVINEFCCEMIKKTNVYGLLKLNVTTIDGKMKFNYDLSKKKSIAEFAKAGFNEGYGRRILYNLCSAFLKLNEYYLKPNYCLLNPEYTYVGDGLNVYLPYIPVKDVKTDPDELRQYFSELLSKYFAVEGVAAYDEMFKYVFQCQTLDLEHFISKFLASEEQSQNNFIAEKQNKAANSRPLPNQGQQMPPQQQPMQQPMQQMQQQPPQQKPQGFKKPLFQKPQVAPMNSAPQGGMKIPGGAGMKIPGGGEINMPGAKGGGFKMPGNGGGGIKMPGGADQGGQMFDNAKKALFGAMKKPQMQQQGVPNMQNMNMPNQNMPNMNIPQNNFQQNNIPPQNNFQQNNMQPRFNGMQGNMDKTIMIDGAGGGQMQNMNMGGGMAYLQYRGQNIPINDSEFVIGKANNQYKMNFAINDNPHVSRKHATIIVQGNTYFIRDEGSTNGTYVNGRSLPKMMPQPLQNGDEISIYDEVFRFCM